MKTFVVRLFHKLWKGGITWFIFFLGTASAQDSLTISLLTCSPGEELYSTFGHSALRIQNFSNSTDIVFNYGTFNFNEKNFYLKFMRGKLNYYLTVTTFDEFMYEYQLENRAVYQQVFDLDANQRSALYRDMEINALPANRRYKYDFFWDNCSTRIRDKIEQIFDQKIVYPDLSATMTFRDYLHKYLTMAPWSRFGIDLILGLPADEITDARKSMFLPMEMMHVYDGAQVHDRPANTRSKSILERHVIPSTLSWLTPLFCLTILLIICILFQRFSATHVLYSVIRSSMMVSTGIAGLIICFLWFIADHQTTDFNLHLIWASPLALLYPVRRKIFKTSQLVMISKIFSGILIAMFVLYPICPQKMPPECLLIWVILLLIVFRDTNWRLKNSKQQNENQLKTVA